MIASRENSPGPFVLLLAVERAMNVFTKHPRTLDSVFDGIILLVIVLAPANTPMAQTLTTGQVFGQVTDPSGAVVPQANVTLRDMATNAVRTTTTHAAGQYTFAQLVPGSYSLTVVAGGFAQTVVPIVSVVVGSGGVIRGAEFQPGRSAIVRAPFALCLLASH